MGDLHTSHLRVHNKELRAPRFNFSSLPHAGWGLVLKSLANDQPIRLHVDYAQARGDQHEHEARMRDRERDIMKEKARRW